MSTSAGPGTASVCIIGAGPRATSLVERLCANADVMGIDGNLHIHLVDPHPAGPGRVWRKDQPGLMWLNTSAADNTIFPDSSVTCDGPVDTGPAFLEWALGEGRSLLDGGDLGPEVARVHPGWFPSRHLYSEYLAWALHRSVASAPASVTVKWHQEKAVDVTEGEEGQLVWFEGRSEALAADVVILAQGQHDVRPDEEEAGLADFALRHGLTYLPRAYTADVDLDRFAPGQEVIVRGSGLAFVDCMVLLFEGRGGSYERHHDGQLVYRPSGREPRLLVGSRRGVPYHSKTNYPLQGPRPPLPHRFTPDALGQLHARLGPLDFERDLQPLIAGDLAFGYYYELWHAHPERTVGSWEDFVHALDASYASYASYADANDADAEDADDDPVAARVPDPADRLDLGWLARPMDGVKLEGAAEMQSCLQAYIAADLARRTDPSYSADLGLIMGLLSCFGVLAVAAGRGLLSARTLALRVDGSFFGFFSYLASGPPPPRLEQLAALSRAGLVNFLGPDLTVSADPVRGCFRAEQAVGSPVEATALLDARLPGPSVARSQDPIVAALFARGECSEDQRNDVDGFEYRTGRLLTDAEHRVVDVGGEAHPARFALGPWTSGGRFSSGIARPRLNAAFFRQNDALARTVLLQVAESAGSDFRADAQPAGRR